jgi:small subunit ribosomal protein S17
MTDAMAEETTTTETSEPTDDAVRNRRKVREGVVVSNKMDKTAVVAVIERVRHPKYGKFMMQTKKLYAHDETNDVNIGDKVRVMETRPTSKNKRWRITEVLERAK